MFSTVAVVTLGCRVNQYESQALRERAEERGLRVVPLDEGADLVLVNSCTVTARADSEARYWARRAKRIRPASWVVLTGCAASSVREGTEWDQVVPQNEKGRLFDLLGPAVSPKEAAPDPWCGGIRRFDGHRRAILKVQDGCRFACAYCAVPGARGSETSRPPEAILAEGRRLAENGVAELVLAGVHLASYGRDLGLGSGAPRLAPVVEGLLALPGIRRVRLSSYGVADFEEALLPLLGKGLCPHLHLPLQSGDDEVLRAMRRPYRLRRFLEVVDLIRSRVGDAGITTDLIAGFPGESEAQFEATLHAVEAADFLDFHPFPFSPRPGTEAASLGRKCGAGVLRGRMDRLLALRRERLQRAALRWNGTVAEVIAERYRPGFLGGTTDHGWKVAFPTGAARAGDEVKVRLGAFRGDRSLAEML